MLGVSKTPTDQCRVRGGEASCRTSCSSGPRLCNLRVFLVPFWPTHAGFLPWAGGCCVLMSHPVRKMGCIWGYHGHRPGKGSPIPHKQCPAGPVHGRRLQTGLLDIWKWSLCTRGREISSQVTRKYSGKCCALGLASLSKQKYLNVGSAALSPGMKYWPHPFAGNTAYHKTLHRVQSWSMDMPAGRGDGNPYC